MSILNDLIRKVNEQTRTLKEHGVLLDGLEDGLAELEDFAYEDDGQEAEMEEAGDEKPEGELEEKLELE